MGNAFNKERVVFVMMVRNDEGHFLLLDSNLVSCSFVHDVESKALE